ncbi:hypothetical protein SPBR_06641 [Sporothrix brasiliensis 5110]|uniref:Carboxylesterase type B domain-containing protein n=1 Tax=Sporothrix brasiliensis 5110 TaxID=1398154 RepID=A0A0C2IMN7_9PEZI|nr:uncharacterized protein SPBR_06641 [Sporothrix brasiliensis 5110]KIH88285.1 hypothetical protein SPBR_06641 [Sporothrix brasiliensis 5110]
MDSRMAAASSPPASSGASTDSGEKAAELTAATPSRLSRFFATRRKTKMTALAFVILGIVAIAVAVPVTEHAKVSHRAQNTFISAASGVTLLVDNDLSGGASTRPALLLLSPRNYFSAEADCKALGEELWGVGDSSTAAVKSIQPLLDYLVYLSQAGPTSRFWISATQDATGNSSSAAPASWRTVDASGNIAAFNGSEVVDTTNVTLSALCTQSAPYSNRSSVNTDPAWTVSVRASVDRPDNGANGVAQVVGRRDHNSFRFLGLRYAPQPVRFTYSTPYWNRTTSATFNSTSTTNNTVLPIVNATKSGSACAQAGGVGSEDCLYLNVFTPYLPAPQQGSLSSPAASASTPGVAPALRPVMFWMHGGGLTGGTGSDPTNDGGNLASRGDVVVVTINYRLSTLGYLALDSEHGGLNGNYGLSDQILALDWVRDNIAAFGGDPERITILGQSAGAGSVRAMMASPLALGKFAAALLMSNLGGLNYGTSYSEYYTIDNVMNASSNAVLQAANCTTGGADGTAANSTAEAIVDCLRAIPAKKLVGLRAVARFIVVDGTYILSDQLQLGAVNTTVNNTAAPYKLMMGTMRDDGAPFIDFPSQQASLADATSAESTYLSSQGYKNISSDLFPIPTTNVNATLDLYNMSSRLSTDAVFRCIDEATVYAGLQSGIFDAAYYYEFDRSYQTTGWPGTNVCAPDATDAHPFGDPSLPYFRCHSGELYYVFGNVARMGLPFRDDGDQPFSQYVLDSFAAFARTYSPNPDADFLTARGFTNTTAMVKASGAWTASTLLKGVSVRLLDWPASSQAELREQPQCESLGLGLYYYL